MPQQARKQHPTESQTTCCSFGDVCRLCTAALISTVLITQTPCGSVHSPVHTLVQIPESRFYRDPFTEGTSSAGVHSLFPLQLPVQSHEMVRNDQHFSFNFSTLTMTIGACLQQPPTCQTNERQLVENTACI